MADQAPGAQGAEGDHQYDAAQTESSGDKDDKKNNKFKCRVSCYGPSCATADATGDACTACRRAVC